MLTLAVLLALILAVHFYRLHLKLKSNGPDRLKAAYLCCDTRRLIIIKKGSTLKYQGRIVSNFLRFYLRLNGWSYSL